MFSLLPSAGPYFYLPKMQSHKEARLWNDVFVEAQDLLNIPRGTIKVLYLICCATMSNGKDKQTFCREV